jgi:hypothetical protein
MGFSPITKEYFRAWEETDFPPLEDAIQLRWNLVRSGFWESEKLWKMTNDIMDGDGDHHHPNLADDYTQEPKEISARTVYEKIFDHCSTERLRGFNRFLSVHLMKADFPPLPIEGACTSKEQRVVFFLCLHQYLL